MLKEFRDFILRGNVVDLAVAVVIGAVVCLVGLAVILTSVSMKRRASREEARL